jgi:acetoin utilization protein AcuC
MRRVIFVSSPALWEHGHGPNHPLKPERLRRTVELLSEYGALDAPNVRVVTSRLATDDELALFHTREYIDVVKALDAGDTDLPAWRYGFGPGDNPVFENMYETESLKVGSAIIAASRLVSGECDVAFSFSGGLHHARPGQASGFCVFNDAAVAIHWLLRQNLRVAYVDTPKARSSRRRRAECLLRHRSSVDDFAAPGWPDAVPRHGLCGRDGNGRGARL